MDELAVLRAQLQIHVFSRSELKLPLELMEVETIFGLSRLLVHAGQEDADILNNLL